MKNVSNIKKKYLLIKAYMYIVYMYNVALKYTFFGCPLKKKKKCDWKNDTLYG